MILGTLETDIGRGFVEGLTRHAPSHYARKLGKHLSDMLHLGVERGKEVENEVCEELIRDLAEAFLALPKDDIKQTPSASGADFFRGHAARNKFYEACLKDPAISGVMFLHTGDDVPRSEFFDYRSAMLPGQTSFLEDEVTWHSEIAEVLVTSPNWDRTDTRRYWKGKCPRLLLQNR